MHVRHHVLSIVLEFPMPKWRSFSEQKATFFCGAWGDLQFIGHQVPCGWEA